MTSTASNRVLSQRKKKVKISEEIIESLRQDIVTGRLTQGEKMPSEKELADAYGVSQPTLREALRGLETMGLVKVRHGSGTYVSGKGEYTLATALLTFMQLEDVGVLELQAVRAVLGVESAALAAANGTTEQVNAIEAALNDMGQNDDSQTVEQVFERLVHFQKVMAAASNNPLLYTLQRFLSTLMMKLQIGLLPSRPLIFWRERVGLAQADRRALYEAIRNRNPQAARQAATNYFDKIRVEFEKDIELRKARLSDPILVESVNAIEQMFELNKR